MLRSLFARKTKSPARRNNGVRQAASVRRNNKAQRGLRAIVAAKTGARRWASRARQTVARRGRPAAQSPRNRYNNQVWVQYNGNIMTYGEMQRRKEMKRLERAGYSPKVARTIVNRNGVANRVANRMGGMWN
jgi:hypothetical protein